MLVTGEAVPMWRQRVCEKALCLPLRLCCEPKTALKKKTSLGHPLVVRWLRRRASNGGSVGSIPSQGTKIPQASQCSQDKTKKQS